jgi:hypothetical protein
MSCAVVEIVSYWWFIARHGWSIWRCYSGICMEGQRKPRYSSGQPLFQLKFQYLSNRSLECHRYTSVCGENCIAREVYIGPTLDIALYQKGKTPQEVEIKLSLCLISYALCHADIRGSGNMDALSLTFALHGGEWPASRPCRFNHRYPLGRRLGGPQSRSGRCGEEKNLALSVIEPWPSNPYPIAIPTEVSLLLSAISSGKNL